MSNRNLKDLLYSEIGPCRITRNKDNFCFSINIYKTAAFGNTFVFLLDFDTISLLLDKLYERLLINIQLLITFATAKKTFCIEHHQNTNREK